MRQRAVVSAAGAMAVALAMALAMALAAGCGHSSSVLRPLPSVAAGSVGKPVAKLKDLLGEPRKIDSTATKLVYVWYVEKRPPGVSTGFHGCELEVSVDSRSQHVIGYSLSNLGWTRCAEIQEKVAVEEP